MQDSILLQSLLRAHTKASPYRQLKTHWRMAEMRKVPAMGRCGMRGEGGICWKSKWRFLSFCLVTIFVHIHYVSFCFIFLWLLFREHLSRPGCFEILIRIGRGKKLGIMEMPVLRWHIHKPYEFLMKKQCPQLDLKWGFLCGRSYSKYTVGGFYFIFRKRYQCKTTLI